MGIGNGIGKKLTYGTDDGIFDLRTQYEYALGNVVSTPLYVNRASGSGFGSTTYSSFPTSVTLSNTAGWGYGANSDALTVSVSGSGVYKITSISRFGVYNASPPSTTFYIRVFDGSTTGGTTLASDTITRVPLFTANRYAEEFVFSTPPLLTKGSTYTIAIGYGSGVSGYNTGYISSSASQSVSTAYGTVTFGNVTSFSGTSPFNSSNGTDRTRGQLPVVGFLF